MTDNSVETCYQKTVLFFKLYMSTTIQTFSQFMSGSQVLIKGNAVWSYVLNIPVCHDPCYAKDRLNITNITLPSMSNGALYDSTRFARHRSSLLEGKIHEIMIHESSSFLKRGNKLQSIPMRHITTRFAQSWVSRKLTSAWRIDNGGNDSCRLDRIKSNRQHF